jgi:hypothetical protein
VEAEEAAAPAQQTAVEEEAVKDSLLVKKLNTQIQWL